MKTKLKFLWLLFFLWIQSEIRANASQDMKTQKSLSTQMSFEDLLVQGTYHFSNESVVTIEEDKVLDSLLEVPKDFKERIKQSAFLY